MDKIKWSFLFFVSLFLCLRPYPAYPQETSPTLSDGRNQRFFSFDYSNFNVPIAGVAGGNAVVFVGEPLNGSVVVLSRFTGQQSVSCRHRLAVSCFPSSCIHLERVTWRSSPQGVCLSNR
jgi:hypothetical protein